MSIPTQDRKPATLSRAFIKLLDEYTPGSLELFLACVDDESERLKKDLCKKVSAQAEITKALGYALLFQDSESDAWKVARSVLEEAKLERRPGKE